MQHCQRNLYYLSECKFSCNTIHRRRCVSFEREIEWFAMEISFICLYLSLYLFAHNFSLEKKFVLLDVERQTTGSLKEKNQGRKWVKDSRYVLEIWNNFEYNSINTAVWRRTLVLAWKVPHKMKRHHARSLTKQGGSKLQPPWQTIPTASGIAPYPDTRLLKFEQPKGSEARNWNWSKHMPNYGPRTHTYTRRRRCVHFLEQFRGPFHLRSTSRRNIAVMEVGIEGKRTRTYIYI